MAAVQDAVKKLSIVFSTVLIIFFTVTLDADGYVETLREIQVYYDSTEPAYLFYEYKLRLLVLINDGRESCWENVNGSLRLVCKPLKNASIRVIYEEIKEYREAETDDNGLAEASYRLLTYPTATFRVEVYSPEGYVETKVRIGTKIWIILTVTSFSLMMGSLVLVVRRCLW